MKQYTQKEIKELKKNPYTYEITKYKLHHTIKFKEDFWIRYQAGDAPRKIIRDLGYDDRIFGQKRIDSLVQRIKKEASSPIGFIEGENRSRRIQMKAPSAEEGQLTPGRMQNEILYLRQEVEFLKKILKADNKETE
jgi:hypothetical protein